MKPQAFDEETSRVFLGPRNPRDWRQSLDSSSKDCRELSEHFIMHQNVRGQDFAALDGEGSAAKIGDFAAGLADDEHARSSVPGIEVEFPKPVKAPAGHVAEIQRGGTGAAHAMRAQRELVIEVDVGVLVPFVAWEAGGNQTFGQARGLRDVNCSAVQPRTSAHGGGEHLLAAGIVDHASYALALVIQRQGNAKHRIAVREVGGAVERVNVPAEIAAGFAPAAFFANQVVLGPLFADALD